MTKNEWVERLKSEHTKARVLAEVVGAAHLVDWARSTKGEQSDLEQQAIDKLEGKSTIYWKATRDSIQWVLEISNAINESTKGILKASLGLKYDTIKASTLQGLFGSRLLEIESALQLLQENRNKGIDVEGWNRLFRKHSIVYADGGFQCGDYPAVKPFRGLPEAWLEEYLQTYRDVLRTKGADARMIQLPPP